MNTLLAKQIQINSALYIFTIQQTNTETCYSLNNLNDGTFYMGTVYNQPLTVEYANKLAKDLEKNQSFFELFKEKIVISYGFMTINLQKQQKQLVTEQNTNQTQIDSKLLKRLESLEQRVNNIEELELKVQQLNTRVNDLEGEIQTNSETFFQNMYSSEKSENVKVFYGSTSKDNTNWTVYSQNSHLKIAIDLSSCNFVTKPTILTSLGGTNYHCSTMGSSSVYYATKDGFYVLVTRSNISPTKVKEWKWHLNWVAIGEVKQN
ncbi:chup1-like protein [Anaeramoeba flamelloides]|uniref:Chup1-like protein n=1 Tax=Anaeramoeba flamelloides TaxID=1746091 RepID=A0ABQ8XJT5_9EUKA|nr:chup1-like protein [Anaeramoeba flamelloides]